MIFDYSDVPCVMPGCDSPLHLMWDSSMSISVGDVDGSTDGVPPTPSEAHVSTWSVGCLEGHVVLVPAPLGTCCDGEHCNCDVDHSEEFRTFRASDVARLVALVKAGVPA